MSEVNKMCNRVSLVIAPRERDLGGFTVRRILPYMKRRMVGPFIFVDHMGPADFEPHHGMDVRPHPHIGLSTLTYLFEGRAFHRDNLGSEQLIEPGAVNWMTAGSGIAHSERTPQGDRARRTHMNGMQTWIALPKEHEETAASFTHHPQKTIPEIDWQGSKVRVIAGEFQGHRSPVGVFSRLVYLDCELNDGCAVTFNEPDIELAVYVATGAVQVGETSYGAGTMVVFETGSEIRLKALQGSRVLLLGGTPFAEPRYIWWNFVSSSEERILRAAEDWCKGRFPGIPTENEFIPLPSEPPSFAKKINGQVVWYP